MKEGSGMKKFKTIFVLVLSLMLVISLTTCGESSTASDRVRHFKLGHVSGPDSPHHYIGVVMNKLLAERMPKYQIDIYPNSQLGGERDMTEALQLGSQDLLITATTPLANFVPSLMVGELLYLIQDYDHADAVYQGELGKQFLEDINAAGFKALGFAEVGFRHFCNARKPINNLSDIAGLKLRVMENPLHVAGWRIMGVDAITTSWSDAIAGMQQGTIDAMEAPWSLIFPNGVYDVAKHAALTGHIYTAQAFIMSPRSWNSMPPEDQKIWMELAAEACKITREYSRAITDDFMQKSINLGMQVTKPDLTEWRERAKQIYAQYDGQYGEMVRKIQALIK